MEVEGSGESITIWMEEEEEEEGHMELDSSSCKFLCECITTCSYF